MTREEIEKYYEVNGSTITSKGAFSGESIYMPHIFDLHLEGLSRESHGDIVVELTDTDRNIFPELNTRQRVYFRIDNNGYIFEVQR